MPNLDEKIAAVDKFLKETSIMLTQKVFFNFRQASESGKYYADCKVAKMNPVAEDDILAEKFWKLSEQLVGLGHQSR